MANGSKASSGPLNAFFTAVFVALDERHMRGHHKLRRRVGGHGIHTLLQHTRVQQGQRQRGVAPVILTRKAWTFICSQLLNDKLQGYGH